MATSDKLDEGLFLRLTAEDMKRIGDLHRRAPALPRSAIIRAALRVGLDGLERDPLLLLGGPPPGEPTKTTKTRRKPSP